jgi:hypothetical protein
MSRFRVPVVVAALLAGAGAQSCTSESASRRAAPLWSVIAPDGRVLRLVRTASNVALLAVTATRAYGVAADELGVHYGYVYELPPG